MADPALRPTLTLGTAQLLAWGSTYYLPAILAVPMARTLGLAPADVFAAFSLALVVSALVGPHAGRAIDRWGGRPVLAGTSLVFAAGLALLGLVDSPLQLALAWALIGIGMGSGLYEGAFAALVRLQGTQARRAITGVTLLGGLASTAGWPLSTWLEAQLGWRGACFAWAGIHLLVGLPLNLLLPRAQPLASSSTAGSAQAPTRANPGLLPAVLLSFVFAATWFISTAYAAHLPRSLQLCGVTSTAAIAVGMLVGPAQVAARIAEYGLLRRVHPLVSARLAAAMHPLAVAALLLAGPPAAVVFGLLHGAGNGILTIAKGTLPLVLFGPAGYGARQGLLMLPARLAQAAAPWAFGLALDRWGAGALWLSAAVGASALAALLALRSDRAGAA